jgi:hypothetical protein
MEKPSLRRRQVIYKWLVSLLIEIPASIIALLLIFAASLLAFYSPFFEMFAWGVGGLSPLSFFPFIIGGTVLLVLKRLSCRLMIAATSIAAGIVIIVLEVWSGAYSIMDTTFEIRDGFPLIAIGVGVGAILGIGIKIGIAVMDNDLRDNQWFLSRTMRNLTLSPLANMFCIGLPIGLICPVEIELWLGYPAVPNVGIALTVGILTAFASGGIDVLCYIVARLVFAPWYKSWERDDVGQTSL